MLPHYTKYSVRCHQGLAPQIGQRVLIDPSAVIIGNVKIGDDASIWPCTVIRGDMHHISIGCRTNIQDGSVLHITHASDFNPGGWPLTIGEDVTVGHNVTLHGCTLGDRILIGMGAVVMDGATIDDEVIVAAGALIPPKRHLEGGFLYAGTPAKQVRPLKEKEFSSFRYTAENYVREKDYHIKELNALHNQD